MTKVHIIDNLPPEATAMLQALYSRSPNSVFEHLKKVETIGSDKFMANYYVGYGHASIGDCGSTTMFIEGVSMLAAKAIQHSPLYRGQEASTRYMDFTEANPVDSTNSTEGRAILDDWMKFYRESQEPLREYLRAEYPIQSGETEEVYTRAVNARAFDILRGFLPAGSRTNLSWHTDIRHAADHLAWLEQHPLTEVRVLAVDLREALHHRYPSSFPSYKQDKLWEAVAMRLYYEDRLAFSHGLALQVRRGPVAFWEPDNLRAIAAWRRKGMSLPPWMAQMGTVSSSFSLDFGSFRDLQRHRNMHMRMPVLRPREFSRWYIDSFPPGWRAGVESFIDEQNERICSLGVVKTDMQYFCGMGSTVSVFLEQNIPAFVYRVELRSSPSVHPTLRVIAQAEAAEFMQQVPDLPLHADLTPYAWDTRRGKQTITERT